MVDTHTGTAGTHYWTDPNAWTHTEAGHIPTDGDSVLIPTGSIVYFDDYEAAWGGIAALTVTSTGELHFALNGTDAKDSAGVYATCYPNAVTAVTRPYLKMATGVSITGTGKLYVGDNATTGAIARPTAISGAYVSNATIELGGAGGISAAYQYYYGWVPSAPAAHPAWTQLVNPQNVNDETLVTTDALDVQAGEWVIVGVGGTPGVMAEAVTSMSKGVYHIRSVGGTGNKTITLTDDNDGKLKTARVAGDIVSLYNRPILITKAAANVTTIFGINSGIMQGVRLFNCKGTTGYYWSFKGVTIDGNNAVCPLATSGPANKFIDCVATYIPTSGLTAADKNSIYVGCVGFNLGYGMCYNGNGIISLYNCAVQNCAYGFGYGIGGGVLVGCVARANTGGGLGLPSQISGNRLVNCTSALNDAALDFPWGPNVSFQGCTLSTGTFVSTYTSNAGIPAWNPVQSRDQNGITGYRAFWGVGGTGTTAQTTQRYGDTTAHPYGTMQFYNLSVTVRIGGEVELPTIWDTPFTLPARKSITLTVPMLATAGEGMSAELWVIDVNNDPLWFDMFWAVTPQIGTTQGNTTATYVLARGAMPTPDTLWHNVTVTVQPQSVERQCKARIIVKGPGAHYTYAYLDTMESQLIAKKRIFL